MRMSEAGKWRSEDKCETMGQEKQNIISKDCFVRLKYVGSTSSKLVLYDTLRPSKQSNAVFILQFCKCVKDTCE